MPLPITPLQEAIVREWIRRLALDFVNGEPGSENLLYNAMILTPTEFEARVDEFRLELIAELQQQIIDENTSIAALEAKIIALGGTP